MRKLIFTLTNLLIITSIWAQTPQKMSYQAIIRNSNDALVISSQIGMEINIHQNSPTGTIVYSETQTPNTNTNGLVSIEIGGGAGFSSINWGSDNFFIETKIAIAEPLTTYTITSVSQLLSVPYALHAKSAENGITTAQADAIIANTAKVGITAQQAADITTNNAKVGITTAQTAKLSGIAEGAEVNVNADWNATSGDAQILNKPTLLTGTAAGQMQYWNGSAWVVVATTQNEGATLQMINGVPTWTGGTPPTPNVTNPITGRTWMDRNLGASQVATSITDANSYGYLYQWGRGTDGHQIRTSLLTNTVSNTSTPGHANFIKASTDWISPQNENLWQGVNGENNPCPSGYRLPTKNEWDEELATWSSQNTAGAFASVLKLPTAGLRLYFAGGVGNEGYSGSYWSSTIIGSDSQCINIEGGYAQTSTAVRATGYSVRCIKN